MALTPLIGQGRMRVIEEAPHEPAVTQSWRHRSLVFDHRRWSCREAELTWTAPSHLIVLTQRGSTTQTRIACAGELVHDGHDRPGMLSFVPAGVERSGLYRNADLVYSALWLDPRLPGLCGRDWATLPILINRADAVVATLLSSLRDEIAAGGMPEAVYVEHLAAVAMHRILALDGAPPRRKDHGRLSGTTLRRVQDHVEAHLDQEIALSDLAAIAGMTGDSFARQFKAAAGLAPYAFVIERRMRRAEDLLARPEMALAQIAMALGFSSQSHFTTTFRRQRGMTPRAYRQRLFS
ncbi:helix-turn-helix transcriptional regulator [Roseomonas hellenica]|uniref:Helix-turn-helix transcriptional regulator n=1 Tax=Plastoroseomonas hellenica TaxID=2687306 RepID=A0ABS5ETM6_9PROT|nr:AraC family transcriptional regulator [Plastoroseomonas hellenica]MBR0663651.1 helix-turn-helix transcriptional regulator [Plastoroseomonas hellenica]